MFHAPISESKQQADAAKSNPPLQRDDAHPTFNGSRALGMPPVAARIPPPSMPAAARKQHMARLQRAYGNQAVLRSLERSRPAIQPKLVVNEPGDAYEQEADHVADQVMRMPDPELSIAAAPAQVSRKCAACEEEKAQMLQTKPAGSPEPAAGEAPPIVHEVLRSPGQPLDAATRAFFEPRFGYDFSGVRVHADAKAAEAAAAVGAMAYTVASHVVFGLGRWAPRSPEGQKLIAHELAHAVQQASSGGSAEHTTGAPVQVQRQGYSPVGGGPAGEAPEYFGLKQVCPITTSCGPSNCDFYDKSEWLDRDAPVGEYHWEHCTYQCDLGGHAYIQTLIDQSTRDAVYSLGPLCLGPPAPFPGAPAPEPSGLPEGTAIA